MTRLIAALLLCVMPSSVALAATPQPLEDHVVWYGSPGTRAYVQPALDLWQKLHPNVAVDIVEANGPDILERLNTEQRAGRPVADLVTFGDQAMYALAANGGLGTYAPSELPNLRSVVPRIRELIDPQHRYVPTYLILFGMAVNTSLLPPAQQPARWTDLLDPKYAGQIGMHDIGVLGAGLSLVMIGRGALGDNFFTTLVTKQKPRIYARAPELDSAVVGGARAVVLPAQYANFSHLKDAPVRWIAPKDGAFLVPVYTGIVKNATHPHAAQAFLDFLLGPAAQNAYAAAGVLPVSSRAKAPFDLNKMALLGKGWITENQAAHLNDWLAIGQKLRGE